MTIRDVTEPDDLNAIVALLNLANPSYPKTVADYLEYKRFNADLLHERWVALASDGGIAGYASLSQNHHEYTAGKYDFDLVVDPVSRGLGYGSALFQVIKQEAQKHNATGIRTYLNSADPAGIRFAEANGFVRTLVCCDVILDVAACAIPSLQALDEQAKVLGLRVSTFADEMQSDPNADQKFHALSTLIRRDIPGPDVLEDVPFEQFLKSLASPNRLGDAQFVAIRDDEWIAMSTLWRRGADDVLQTGATGVVRSERGKGIAMLLKHYAVHYAKRRGAPQIITDNAEQNAPMRAINKKLGFVALPEAWLMEKSL